MILKIPKRIIMATFISLVSLLVVLTIILNLTETSNNLIMGGKICIANSEISSATRVQDVSLADERFDRPSKQNPLPNKYSFADFEKHDNTPPLITKKFEMPEEVIFAYFGILKDASNMLGYSGGCGSIGMGNLPYPYAYEFFTDEARVNMSLKDFTQSFEGIGHITFLKLYPAYIPPDTPDNIKYYMFEIETISGRYETDKDYNKNRDSSLFGYYYGIITVEKTENEGWKIKDIDYRNENFLCAPMHGWFYLADAVVGIVYMDNLKIIDKIDKSEMQGNFTYVYASGGGKNYRFDFVRLTNGYDVLMHEYVMENGKWVETSLLTEDWQYLKLLPCK